MVNLIAGWLVNGFYSTYRQVTRGAVYPGIFVQTRDYAARKGTREKARRKKVKAVVEKMGFIAHNLRKSSRNKAVAAEVERVVQFRDDADQDVSRDDVYIIKDFQRIAYTFAEAVINHRETYHPTMYDLPDVSIHASVELKMKPEKKRSGIITSLIDIPHKFERQEDRTVLAFSKNAEEQAIAKAAGADVSGGTNIVKAIEAGKLSIKEYDYVVAHTNMLPDLLLIRGLMKRKFPSLHTGTLGNDMKQLVERVKGGLLFVATPFSTNKAYGTTTVKVGPINADIEALEANFRAIIRDIDASISKGATTSILRVSITCPPTKESFKLDISSYLSDRKKDPEESEQLDEQDAEGVIAVN